VGPIGAGRENVLVEESSWRMNMLRTGKKTRAAHGPRTRISCYRPAPGKLDAAAAGAQPTVDAECNAPGARSVPIVSGAAPVMPVVALGW
jgi:hypothetical protein